MLVPAELSQFVEAEVASGRFPDPVAVVAHALQLLRRDRDEAVRGIQRGLDDTTAGRMQPLAEVFGELRREFLANGT